MKNLDFSGQVAIVTGSNSQIGLGFHYARRLGQCGAKVCVHGRKPEAVAEAAKVLADEGLDIMYHVCDMTDRDAVGGMVDAVMDKWGRVDILVNNAGTPAGDVWPYSSPEADYGQLQFTFECNVKGTLYGMEAVWPIMKKQGGGVIVVVSSNSVFGFVPTVGYPATKASLLPVTRIAAYMGQADNIKVNAIAPCAESQLTMQLPDEEFKKKLREEATADMASAALAALCSKDNPHTGAFFSIGGERIMRYNFFESGPHSAKDPEDALASLRTLAGEDVAYEPVNNAFADLKNFNFSEELYRHIGMM